MDVVAILYHIISAGLIAFFSLFAFYSVIEKKQRAATISIIFVFALIFQFYFAYEYDTDNIYRYAFLLVSAMFLFLFFAPFGKKNDIKIAKSNERFDERDTMFARNDYMPGSQEYELYYTMHPEFKKIDDKIRSKPDLLEPGSKYYDKHRAEYVKGLFELEGTLANFVDGDVNDKQINISEEEATILIKEKALQLGAAEVGIALLDKRCIYTHVGRGPEKWGEEIKNDHKFAVCFTVEMDYEKVSEAPKFDVIEETAKQYINAQRISILLANFIRRLGYSARAHVSGSNYQIILPAVAYFAGLGELGRHGYLISKKYGSRVRLGAITTDLPIIPDKPVNIGVQEFCDKCKKCAVNCPSKSITEGNKEDVRGVEKWQLKIEQCYQYWKKAGTDCALCMKVCPFSHPDNLPHNLIRYGISKSSFARQMSLWGDDLFYGKKWQ